MTDRDGHEPMDEVQSALERSLIESARTDALPEGATERAWKRFSTSAGALAVGTGEPGPGFPTGKAERVARATATKWLLLGALGGSAVTAAWFASRVPVTSTAPPSAPSLRPAPAVATVWTPAHSTVESATTDPLPPKASSSVAEQAPAPPPRTRPNVAARGSTLAAEVTLLDSVRAALAGGAPDQAVRTVERYHREFPVGLLAADAEALALEAIVAQGERALAAQRARRFLERHPNDPHAPRAREIVEITTDR